jgi:hypothetical protein
MGSNEDAKIVSELMDDIRAAVVDCQVSSEAQTVSEICVANEYSLLHLHLAYLANRLPRRRGPVSDATS